MTKAVARLRELHEWLAGESAESLRGVVRDAREALHRKAAALHFPTIPAEYRGRDTVEPTESQRLSFRALIAHGYDPHTYLANVFQSARSKLESLSRSPAVAQHPAPTLTAWADEVDRNLRTAVRTLLVDSAEQADVIAGRELLNPELIDDSPAE